MLKDLILKETIKTPYIYLNANTGEFVFSGRSIPENTTEFFAPVMNWIDAYLNDPGDNTTFIIKLEYFNTSTSKNLVEIFRKFEKLFQSGKDVLIQWHYDQEDEDMYETGEDFREIIKIPVELKVI